MNGTAICLFHRVDAAKAAQYLAHLLRCDHWYVVRRLDHQLVVHLSQHGVDRYAVSFECTAPVDKSIYHGSMTSHLSVVSLQDEPELSEDAIEQIKSGLAHL